MYKPARDATPGKNNESQWNNGPDTILNNNCWTRVRSQDNRIQPDKIPVCYFAFSLFSDFVGFLKFRIQPKYRIRLDIYLGYKGSLIPDLTKIPDPAGYRF